MQLSGLERYYLLDVLPDGAGSLEEVTTMEGLKPRLAWSEEEVKEIGLGEQERVPATAFETLDPTEVKLSEDERALIGKGLVLYEAQKGTDNELPTDSVFAGLVREFSDEIDAAKS